MKHWQILPNKLHSEDPPNPTSKNQNWQQIHRYDVDITISLVYNDYTDIFDIKIWWQENIMIWVSEASTEKYLFDVGCV